MANNRIYIAFLFVIIVLIIVAVIAINLIDKYSNPLSNSKFSDKDLNELNLSINNLKSSPYSGRGKIDEYFKNITVEKSESEKIKYIEALFTEIVFNYSETNDPNYVKTLELIKSYISKNFPKYYSENKDTYNYPCIDPSCADTPQPKEILNIVEEIKKSDLPKELQTTLIMDLINTGYRSKTQNETKATQYFLLAQDLKNNIDASKTKQNIIIGDKLLNFIKNNFPTEYSQLSNNE